MLTLKVQSLKKNKNQLANENPQSQTTRFTYIKTNKFNKNND